MKDSIKTHECVIVMHQVYDTKFTKNKNKNRNGKVKILKQELNEALHYLSVQNNL